LIVIVRVAMRSRAPGLSVRRCVIAGDVLKRSVPVALLSGASVRSSGRAAASTSSSGI